MSTTVSMHIDDELHGTYENLAQATARSRDELMKEALEQYAAQKTEKIALVQEGRNQLQAGQGIPHDAVIALLQERGILPRDERVGA